MTYTKNEILKLVNEATSVLEKRINVDVLNNKDYTDTFKKFQTLAAVESASHFIYGYITAKLEKEEKK